jgi:hypothetical protein
MTIHNAPQELRPSQEFSPDQDNLSERIAGQAVMEKLLSDRAGIPSPSLLGRFFGADPLTQDNHPWYKGALGEIAVGRVLARLGTEWMVLHAVPVGAGSSDIDHVLIGPAGVFTVNTKNHSGQSVWVAGQIMMVAGKKQRHLYNASHEAERAAKILTRAVNHAVDVRGVVVVVAPKSLTIREPPAGVAVVTDTQLLRWLRGLPPTLSPQQVASIAAVAARPGTWHRNPPASTDAAPLQHAFVALRARVDRARRRRAAWILALLLMPLAVVLVTLSSHF